MKFLKGRGKTRGANPKQFDECIYSPYDYDRVKRDRKRSRDGDLDGQSKGTVTSPVPVRERRFSDSAVNVEELKKRREEHLDLLADGGAPELENGESSIPNPNTDLQHPQPLRENAVDFDTQVDTPEVFLFEYGTVVIWGMTLQQEERFLKDIARFENEKLGPDDVQTENFNFYYTREYQARIYNDFISLREKKNYMTKLAISHALAQSVKVRAIILSLFILSPKPS